MINTIYNKLKPLSEFKQVVIAGGPGNKPRLDTAKLLCDLVRETIPETNFIAHEEVPSTVYATLNLASSSNQLLDKHVITQSDTYVCSVRDGRLEPCIKKSRDLVASIDASPLGVEVTDAMQDRDEESKTFRTHLEITFTVPATGASAEVPAVLVYLSSESAEPSKSDNRLRQQITEVYGVTILTASANLTQLKNTVKRELLGLVSSDYDALELVQGSPLENEGGLEGWHYLFSTKTTIIQT